MRKIIAKTDMTLDGVISDPASFSASHWNEEWNALAGELGDATGTLLMGRKTYEGFAAAWPNMEETEGAFAVKMNSMPKYVVSATLERADWNNTTIIRDDVTAAVAKLKDEPGPDIIMYGFGPLAHQLLRDKLLDELQVWIYPVLAGNTEVSDLLFRDGSTVALRLAGTRTLATGVVVLTYVRAEETPAA